MKLFNNMKKDVSLVILDIMMPGMSGIEVCRKIREISYIPILFLTAKNTESDKIEGFQVGGDDYLIKPFSYVELSMRVEVLLRRCFEYDRSPYLEERQTERDWLEYHEIKLNKRKNKVFVENKEVTLTEKEYGILKLLMSYPGQIFSVNHIYESVWNEVYRTTVSNTVMVHIRQIRKKLEKDPKNPERIRTVWGKGYCFEL